MRRILALFSHGEEAMLGVYLPGYAGYTHPCICTPVHPWVHQPSVASHDRCVYTEHARRGYQALEHRVAELTVSDGRVTVVTAHRGYRPSVLLFVEECWEEACGPYGGETYEQQ